MFGLLIVFTAAQVWGDLELANSAVADEASALRDIVLLAKSLSEDNNSRLRAPVERHIEVSETQEWPALAKGHAAIAMPTALREALREVLAFPTADDTQKTAKSEIIKALQKPWTPAVSGLLLVKQLSVGLGGSAFWSPGSAL